MTNIKKAVEILKAGGVVGMPTETVYGLAASVESSAGINSIFETKERPFFDPLIIHIASIEQAKAYIKSWPKVCDILARKYWPGPVTFILPKSDLVSDLICSGLDTVGIRMPNHPLALELINELGHPVAAPSANKFKKTSPTCAQDVLSEFEDVMVLNGGPCEVGIESTILGIFEKEICIFRPGMLSQSEIELELKRNDIEMKVTHKESPVAPGHLEHHYMPNTPVITVTQKITSANTTHIPYELLSSVSTWTLPKEAALAARQLYSKFRELDQEETSAIIIELSKEQLEDEKFGGILNRLIKASSYTLPKELSNKS